MTNSFVFHVDPPSVADSADEIGIQTRLRARMKMLAPTVRLVSAANGVRTTAWGAMKAKREGMSAGYPDLIAIAPDKIAFLEIKTRTGSLSGEQKNWLNWLTWAGHPCGCFRSVDTAVAFLREHGFPFLDLEAAA